jgi:protein-S-isoprenylcysteine O-methyltransferase Ste14
MREEKDVEQQFGKEFMEYKKKVLAFIPKFK